MDIFHQVPGVHPSSPVLFHRGSRPSTPQHQGSPRASMNASPMPLVFPHAASSRRKQAQEAEEFEALLDHLDEVEEENRELQQKCERLESEIEKKEFQIKTFERLRKLETSRPASPTIGGRKPARPPTTAEELAAEALKALTFAREELAQKQQELDDSKYEVKKGQKERKVLERTLQETMKELQLASTKGYESLRREEPKPLRQAKSILKRFSSITTAKFWDTYIGSDVLFVSFTSFLSALRQALLDAGETDAVKLLISLPRNVLEHILAGHDKQVDVFEFDSTLGVSGFPNGLILWLSDLKHAIDRARAVTESSLKQVAMQYSKDSAQHLQEEKQRAEESDSPNGSEQIFVPTELLLKLVTAHEKSLHFHDIGQTYHELLLAAREQIDAEQDPDMLFFILQKAVDCISNFSHFIEETKFQNSQEVKSLQKDVQLKNFEMQKMEKDFEREMNELKERHEYECSEILKRLEEAEERVEELTWQLEGQQQPDESQA